MLMMKRYLDSEASADGQGDFVIMEKKMGAT